MPLIEAFSTAAAQATPAAIAKHVRETYLGQMEGGELVKAPTSAGNFWTDDQPVRDAGSNPHQRRRQNVAERLRYYSDGYVHDVRSLIDLVFEHEKVKAQRRRLAPLAMSMNVTKRIIDEFSSVYDTPAERSFDSEQLTEEFRAVEMELELHDLMAEAQRMTNLCNEVLIWTDPTLRILTPDSFDVIADPRDHLTPAGYLIDWGGGGGYLQGLARQMAVQYRIYDESIVIELNGDGRFLRSFEHGRGRLPGILVHRRRPVRCLLDAESGADILAAHKTVVLLRLLTIRLAKSQGENQPILKGALARMATGQAMDGETPIALPPDVDIDVLNLRTDPDHYLKIQRDTIAGVASTYGLSYEQLTLQETTETTSGRAYKIRREKLTELRRQQAKRWRGVERELVELLGFDSSRFGVNFGEMAVPQDAKEEFELFQAKMRQGLDSHVAFLMRQDPDLTPTEAAVLIRDNVRMSSAVIELLRAQNAQRDFDITNPGRTPEENGADNQPKPTPADSTAGQGVEVA